METSYIDLIMRLSLALVLGGAIGLEREYRAKEAGFRTHFLVALGSEGLVACGGTGGVGHRFLRCRNHHLSEERGARTHYGCRTLGYGGDRSGLRHWHVRCCDAGYGDGTAGLGGDKRHDSAARHHKCRGVVLGYVDRERAAGDSKHAIRRNGRADLSD